MILQQAVLGCDQCKEPIPKLYGPIYIRVRSGTEPEINADLEFCSFKCLGIWANKRK